jgi:hypothetical protein
MSHQIEQENPQGTQKSAPATKPGRFANDDAVLLVPNIRGLLPCSRAGMFKHHGDKPLGLRWRASYWLTTLVVGCGMPFRFIAHDK